MQEAMRREILGILFFFLVIFTAVSLLSYSPGDPSINTAASSAHVNNFFGLVGAYTAGGLLGLFGMGAFWIPILFLIASFRFYSNRNGKALIPVAIGGLLLMITTGALFGMFHEMLPLFDRLFNNTGGIIGYPLAYVLREYVNRAGAVVLLLLFFIIGFILTTRISVVRALKNMLMLLRWAAARLRDASRHMVSAVRAKKEARKAQPKPVKPKKAAKARPQKEPQPKREVPIQDEVSPSSAAILPASPQKSVVSPPSRSQLVFESMRVDDGVFRLPPLDFLNDPVEMDGSVDHELLQKQSVLLEQKLSDFGVQGKVTAVLPGPVITRFELEPAPGVKINKVVNLTDDLALALKALSVRIIAPIPGKAAIGIELPNAVREVVVFKDIVGAPVFQKSTAMLTIALGKDIVGNPVVADLETMPHLLIAGATGTGKSVALNTMISSVLYKATPENVKFIMIDPKRIELSTYDGIPHLITPVVTDMKLATNALFWAVREMERRYKLLSEKKVRNIKQYNSKVAKETPAEGEAPAEKLPYIVVVIDELADLMMVSSRDVEVALARLAQMARAAGVHLIIATQRPSVDVLTGVIKANFPTRLSFQVSSKIDSRTIIDSNGAETLLGNGDMLFLPPGTAKLQRIHGAYISDEEVSQIIEFLKAQKEPEYDHGVVESPEPEKGENGEEDYDERYDEAVALVTRTGQASISMVQRHLRIGYNRAARIIEMMEKEGIVGPSDGVKPREVIARGYDDLP